MILGLTGGIASGKSTVSKILRKMGAEVVDADRVAKEVSGRRDIIEKLVEVFGGEILQSGKGTGEKVINRDKLREVVFKEKENVKKINNIIHPQVIEVFEERRKASLPDEIIIFDIPLLFEAGLEYLCDKVLVVSVSKKTQIKRVMARDRGSVETAENIIKNQMSCEEKEERADYIIRNDRGIRELKEEVARVYEKISEGMDR